MKFLHPFLIALIFLSFNAYGHGITATSAEIQVRPSNLIELKLQFNWIDLLNYQSNQYTLPVVASLPKEKFTLLYNEVKKLFQKELVIKKGSTRLEMNMRFPSQEQVLKLLKREFVESQLQQTQTDIPYTFSDRRFYQIFYVDFLIDSHKDINALSISFPKPLGNIYTTLSYSSNQELHQGTVWMAK